MGVLGSMFPQQKLRHEGGEAGNAQRKPEISSIDLENGTVTLSGLTADPPTEPVVRDRSER